MYTEILDLLKKHKVDTYHAFVATACDSAWNIITENEAKPDITYDEFAEACEAIWIDDIGVTSLTVIADRFADFYFMNDKLPESFEDIEETI